MREFLTFMTACVVLGIVHTLTTALGIVVLIVALMTSVTYPRQTFGSVALLALLSLAMQRPAVSIAALGAIGITVAITRRQVQPSFTLRLPSAPSRDP